MLRPLILLLLLANGGYLAWSQEWLADLGTWAAPAAQHEPTRLAKQIKPELVTLLNSAPPTQPVPAPVRPAPATTASQQPSPPPSLAATAAEPTTTSAAPATPEAATPSAPPPPAPGTQASAATPTAPPAPVAPAPVAPAPAATPPVATSSPPPAPATPSPATSTATQCMLAGPFDDDQTTVLKAALAKTLPKDSWQMEGSVQRGRWIIYSGKLADNDALEARKAELKQLKVAYREVNSKELQPGLVLGTFSAEASAQQGLKDVGRAGVKGAKVLEVRPDVSAHLLRLPKATEAQLTAATQAIAKAAGASTSDNTLRPCR